MTELRRRMIQQMTVRGFSPRTHESYLAAVRGLAKHYGRPSDQLSADEVQAYIVHMMTARKLSFSTCNIAASAFRFLYHVTLGYEAITFEVPAPKQPQRLPEILSREEVTRLIEAPPNPKHRLLLATVYAAGLRVSEAVGLRVGDVDRGRMTLRIEQAKGRKDRVVPLSRRLLAQMDGPPLLGRVRAPPVPRPHGSYAALRLPRLRQPRLRFPLPATYLDADTFLGRRRVVRLRARRRRRVTGFSVDPDHSRKGEGLPGCWAVLFLRAVVQDPAGYVLSSPISRRGRHRLQAIQHAGHPG